jgi:hypothetical protein
MKWRWRLNMDFWTWFKSIPGKMEKGEKGGKAGKQKRSASAEYRFQDTVSEHLWQVVSRQANGASC